MVQACDTVRREDSSPKFCLGCSYSLNALQSNRCPECGRGFSLDVPESYAAAPLDAWYHRLSRSSVRVGGYGLVCVTLLFSLAIGVSQYPDNGWIAGALVHLAVVFLCAVVALFLIGTATDAGYRRRCVAGLTVAGVIPLTWWAVMCALSTDANERGNIATREAIINLVRTVERFRDQHDRIPINERELAGMVGQAVPIPANGMKIEYLPASGPSQHYLIRSVGQGPEGMIYFYDSDCPDAGVQVEPF